MKYLGSKARIIKTILPIIKDVRPNAKLWLEPFVGGANSICKVKGMERYGIDVSPYLIEMWKALQDGWEPPKFISRDLYSAQREEYNTAKVADYALCGYVGFSGSYGGRFFDGGYAGITKTKCGKTRNYPEEAYYNIMKQVPEIIGVNFICGDYSASPLVFDSIIYCDPPYKDTKQYKFGICYEDFYIWCEEMKNNNNSVLVSGYEMPENFKLIWQAEVSSSLRANSVISVSKKSTERLFLL